MKRAFRILVFFAVATAQAAPFITIGDLKLFQAYAPPESEIALREYLPAGESLQNWTRMGSVRVFKEQKDPKKYLKAVAKQVSKSHPAARFQFLENATTKSLVLDFMTFPPESTSPFYAEWNLMRASFVPGKGLVVYQYALRIFDVGPEMPEMVKREREKMVGPFDLATFEESN